MSVAKVFSVSNVLALAVGATWLCGASAARAQTADQSPPTAQDETADPTVSDDQQQLPAGEPTTEQQQTEQQQQQTELTDPAAPDSAAAPGEQPQPRSSQPGEPQADPSSAAPGAPGNDGGMQRRGEIPQPTDEQGQLQDQAGVDVQSQRGELQPADVGVRFAPAQGGLVIADLIADSFFHRSGLRPRDVLVAVNGQPIRNQVEFLQWFSRFPGQRLPVVVLRDGRRETIYVTYPQPRSAQAYLGVTFDPQFPDAVVVSSVRPESPAERAGLRGGDMITALNGYRVDSPFDVTQIIASMRPGQRIDVDFSRRIHSRTEAVLASRPRPPRYSVGYAPQIDTREFGPPAPPAVDQVPQTVDRAVVDPAIPQRQFDAPVRPAVPDRDGRIWDGDGRIPRRELRDRD